MELSMKEKINLLLKVLTFLLAIGLWIFKLYVPATIITALVLYDVYIINRDYKNYKTNKGGKK